MTFPKLPCMKIKFCPKGENSMHEVVYSAIIHISGAKSSSKGQHFYFLNRNIIFRKMSYSYMKISYFYA